MHKRIRYYLPICILSFIISACHMDTGMPGGPGDMVTGPGISGTGKEGTYEVENEEPQCADTEPVSTDTEPASADTEPASGTAPVTADTDFVLPDSDCRLYSRQELENLSAEQLRIARNEIYARHGRIFKDDTLQAYFQSRAWYRGMTGPEEFDDGQLNQTERNNIDLLRGLEQDRKMDTRADAMDNGDSAGIPIHTGYADTVNKNQYRRLYLEAGERSDADGQVRSQVIDCGGYYEVTNGCILADTCYPRSVTDGKHAGDTLQLGDALYRIAEMDDLDLKDRGSVYLEYLSGSGEAEFMGYYLLARAAHKDFYILVGEDADTQTDILYTGSLYFSKDCITRVNNPYDSFRVHTVPISDYLTRDKKTVGSQLGLYPSGDLVLWGDFECDSSGLIISYSEIFLS